MRLFKPYPEDLTPKTRVIAGYAAVFDERDRGGDLIKFGAFTNSLARLKPFPFLKSHDPKQVIGNLLMAYQDDFGLAVVIALGSDCPDIAIGQGLSFGYRVRRKRGVKRRTLYELELVEISIVEEPMQPRARVTRIGPAKAFGVCENEEVA